MIKTGKGDHPIFEGRRRRFMIADGLTIVSRHLTQPDFGKGLFITVTK